MLKIWRTVLGIIFIASCSHSLNAQTFAPIPPLAFVKAFGGADPLPQTITVTSTGTNFDFNYTASTAAGGNWLSVAVVGFNCCTTPRALTVVVTAAPTLAAGAYAGQVVLTSQSGTASLTIPVTLTVEAPGGAFFNNLPGQLAFSLKTGNTALTSQDLGIMNGGSGSLNWTLTKSTSDGGDWLTVSATSGTAPSAVTIGVNVPKLPNAGLIAGNFIGQLVLQAPSGNVTVPISVVVGANIFQQVNGIAFSKVFGEADPLPQTVTFASTGTNFDFDYRVYTGTGGNWLSVAVVGFNCCATPRALTAVVTTSASLAVGTYTGEIIATVEGNGSMAITIPVTLTVESVSGTFFNTLPGQLSFSLQTAGTTITSQTIQVQNGGSGALNWSVSTNTSDAGNWLTVSPSSGTAPSQVTVGVTVPLLPGAGLIAGNFVGELVFSQPSGGSVTVPVSVVVGANILTQVNGVAFTKVFGGPDPLPQTVTFASTGTNFDFDYTTYTSTGGNWLSVAVVGFNCCATPRALTAVVTTSPTLPVGTYTGEIIATVEGNGSMAITVPVTLTVEPAAAIFLDDLPGQLSFSFAPGTGNPPSQDVQIRPRGAASLAWTVTTTTADGGNWLTVSSNNGTAPSTISVGVVASALPGQGLIAGTFLGNVVVRSATGSTTIPVSVSVGPNVFVQLPGLTFTKTFGGANPLSQDVTIASTGTNFDFDYRTYTATGGNWLSVTVSGFNCCATPRDITANIVSSPTLAAGTYTGEIIVTVEGNGDEAMTIPVTLIVGMESPQHPPSKVGIFRAGFLWIEDVDGNQQFNAPPDAVFAFGGVPGDVPITGDWNGNGHTKVGIYRAASGQFLLDYDGDGQFTAADKVYNLGIGTQPTDIPVVGDWNGDGRSKVGIFRQGFFWILDTNGDGVFGGADQAFAFGGLPGDVPLVGDWNGSGTSKVGIFRAGFLWILDTNGNHTVDAGDQIFPFGGITGDVPVVGDWNGDGTTKVGIFRLGFLWVLDANGNRQFDGVGAGKDLAFPYGGSPGDIPVVGKW